MARLSTGMKEHFSSWPPNPLVAPDAFRLVATMVFFRSQLGHWAMIISSPEPTATWHCVVKE
jgi:hypothetical protein